MNKIGIIDIEAECLTMTLAETSGKGYFKIIDELKEYLNFDITIYKNELLEDLLFKKILNTLKIFKTMCINAGVCELILIASKNLSSKENILKFKEYLYSALNIELKILSNEDELYYNYLGAKNSMFIENSLLLDINGYSINFAYIQNNQIINKAHLPFGFISISNEFDLNNKSLFLTAENLNTYLKDEFSKIEWLKNTKFDSIIIMGNMANCLGKIDRTRKHYPINNSHEYKFYLEDITELYNLVKSKDIKHRLQISGLKACYVYTILAAISILKSAAELTSTDEIDICGYGLREGLLFNYLATHFENKKDILDSSLIGIIDSININKNHAFQVYKIASKLFIELSTIHKINTTKFKRILKTAALLHDSGVSIGYQNHHINSFYVILNSNINGLNHKELLMSAFAAALHRNNDFSIPVARYSSIINRLDASNVEYIGILLRIAEGLDRSLCSAIDNIDVKITNDTVIIKLYAQKNIDLEIYEAYRAKDAFQAIYNKILIIKKA